MERILGLDFGEKRIGVAVSDPLGLTAQPRPYLPNDAKLWVTLEALLKENEVRTVVLGLPKAPDGSDSAKAAEVRAFAEQIKTKFGCEIRFQDERFSTRAVTRTLIDADVSRKKRKEVVDSAAAAFILQGVLDANF